MNNNLQTVFRYHEQTKHSLQKYANSLGYMDWATQPDPFRNYNGTTEIKLPLSFENSTPPYHLLNSDLPSAPLVLESISQLLQFSMGIAAYKESGGNSWAVRCNASSGNLHPTETYLVLPPVLKEQSESTCIYHYVPKNHGLEKLTSFETSFWDTLPSGSFLLGLSSITWREVWKYGERAFRYTQLDAGHAWQSLVVSAKMLGWKITRLDSVSDDDINTLFGLKQKDRYFEDENADMLFVISPLHAVCPLGIESNLHVEDLLENIPLSFDGIANKLSKTMQSWEIIPEIENACSYMQKAQNKAIYLHPRGTLHVEQELSQESKTVVLNRRSIHVMDKETSLISKKEFHTVLSSVSSSLDNKENSTHLVLFVHKVQEYKSGLYILIRNDRDKESLENEMHTNFSWGTTDLENFYLLEERDLKTASKSVSCSQDIASDGAFSLGMLCNFSEQLQDFGAHRYKELYWECGAIGQQLYLESTSLGLSGTGIGCFLDDMMHGLLGIKNNKFQILYHFTVGRGYVDSRIMTKPAY